MVMRYNVEDGFTGGYFIPIRQVMKVRIVDHARAMAFCSLSFNRRCRFQKGLTPDPALELCSFLPTFRNAVQYQSMFFFRFYEGEINGYPHFYLHFLDCQCVWAAFHEFISHLLCFVSFLNYLLTSFTPLPLQRLSFLKNQLI